MEKRCTLALACIMWDTVIFTLRKDKNSRGTSNAARNNVMFRASSTIFRNFFPSGRIEYGPYADNAICNRSNHSVRTEAETIT